MLKANDTQQIDQAEVLYRKDNQSTLPKHIEQHVPYYPCLYSNSRRSTGEGQHPLVKRGRNNKKAIIKYCQFLWQDDGTWDRQGNAAEMITVKGVAKGGSYHHFASERMPGVVNAYSGAQPWLGFRCIAVRRYSRN